MAFPCKEHNWNCSFTPDFSKSVGEHWCFPARHVMDEHQVLPLRPVGRLKLMLPCLTGSKKSDGSALNVKHRRCVQSPFKLFFFVMGLPFSNVFSKKINPNPTWDKSNEFGKRSVSCVSFNVYNILYISGVFFCLPASGLVTAQSNAKITGFNLGHSAGAPSCKRKTKPQLKCCVWCENLCRVNVA